MAYSVSYKKSVQKDLASLPKAAGEKGDRSNLCEAPSGPFRQIGPVPFFPSLDKIEKELTTRPEACPPLKGQFAGLRKLRVGTYRVIFAILEKQVLVLRIGHRRDVYER